MLWRALSKTADEWISYYTFLVYIVSHRIRDCFTFIVYVWNISNLFKAAIKRARIETQHLAILYSTELVPQFRTEYSQIWNYTIWVRLSNTADNIRCACLWSHQYPLWTSVRYHKLWTPCRTYFNHTATEHNKYIFSIYFLQIFCRYTLLFYYIYIDSFIFCYDESWYTQRNVWGA